MVICSVHTEDKPPASGDNVHLTSFLSLGESAVLRVYAFQHSVCVCVCHRLRHVAPHAGSQGCWVRMSSGTANGGGSQLSSWITEDGVGRQWMFVGGACSHHSSCDTPVGTESCRVEQKGPLMCMFCSLSGSLWRWIQT